MGSRGVARSGMGKTAKEGWFHFLYMFDGIVYILYGLHERSVANFAEFLMITLLFYRVNVKCVFWTGLTFMFCKVCEFSRHDEKLRRDAKFGSVVKRAELSSDGF